MASDTIDAAQDMAYVGSGPPKGPPKLFKIGQKAWLLATDDSPNIRVTIEQTSENPTTKRWEYQVKDNQGALSWVATEEHTRRQIIWDRKMKNGTESRRHYKQTAVLLVSFEKNDLPGLDSEVCSFNKLDAQCELTIPPKVEDLSHVFEHDYGFQVDTKMINSTENSQWDLMNHLTAFFSKYDSEQTLLIIYYAGHGWAPPSLHEEFNIHGRSNVARSDINCVKWHEAENMLCYVKADIFAIFDCCNAGRLCHTRGPALWEVLGACSENQTTEPPSAESFTRALIWALKELRQKDKCRFSTSELRKKIKEAPGLPKQQQPPLKNRTNDSLPT
ncbi:hypothetical protein FKW77_003042 [Venturia effusa]|uniref:Caspase family p20 domain-containing protein n=1 Tax=Venturia effusa TaxID=50376 RepID=A0A517LPU3_9PEZI|nr:hypothetical protein FKW77_003042 [Venturia effusa]